MPAMAMPLPLAVPFLILFKAITPNTIDTMAKIQPRHQNKTSATMPVTSETIANADDGAAGPAAGA
jgi:hypothetical protein